ncbi:hypothetical protein L3X38_032706 [Prunus dulcis]|uniref:Uncharacterized protein n=1 Tax=Prunus dulcis TaxID=3755 RepID=A0AAD4YWB0_PRUDU|nr:hypothetical protein L3X38_032706 [Prunus dulcis]
MNQAVPATKQLAPRQPCLLPCRRKTHFRGRADPARKRLAPRQPCLLPCRRKTHFRGARHLPKLSNAKPNLQDTCRHHHGLHKVLHWNFVQSSHFHFPINREQYPGLSNPLHPRASALFPAEDLVPLITKLDSNSGRAILSINNWDKTLYVDATTSNPEKSMGVAFETGNDSDAGSFPDIVDVDPESDFE